MALSPQTHDFLGELPDQARAAFVAAATRKQLQRGEALFLQDDPAWNVGVVERGHVKLSVVGSGGRVDLVRLWGPGELAGHVAAMDRANHVGTATAVGSAEVLVVRTGDFERLLEQHPAMYPPLVRQLTGWIRLAVGSQSDQGTEPIVVRLARQLCRMVGPDRDMAGSTPGSQALQVQLTQEELAQTIGSSRESTARVLREWRELGLVTTSRRHLEIHRIDRICEIALQGHLSDTRW